MEKQQSFFVVFAKREERQGGLAHIRAIGWQAKNEKPEGPMMTSKRFMNNQSPLLSSLVFSIAHNIL